MTHSAVNNLTDKIETTNEEMIQYEAGWAAIERQRREANAQSAVVAERIEAKQRAAAIKRRKLQIAARSNQNQLNHAASSLASATTIAPSVDVSEAASSTTLATTVTETSNADNLLCDEPRVHLHESHRVAILVAKRNSAAAGVVRLRDALQRQYRWRWRPPQHGTRATVRFERRDASQRLLVAPADRVSAKAVSLAFVMTNWPDAHRKPLSSLHFDLAFHVLCLQMFHNVVQRDLCKALQSRGIDVRCCARVRVTCAYSQLPPRAAQTRNTLFTQLFRLSLENVIDSGLANDNSIERQICDGTLCAPSWRLLAKSFTRKRNLRQIFPTP